MLQQSQSSQVGIQSKRRVGSSVINTASNDYLPNNMFQEGSMSVLNRENPNAPFISRNLIDTNYTSSPSKAMIHKHEGKVFTSLKNFANTPQKLSTISTSAKVQSIPSQKESIML